MTHLLREDAPEARSLSVQAAIATKQITELENELGAANEGIATRDNENGSLQGSLELTLSENSRLSDQLSEKDVILKKTFLELDQLKTALAATTAERNSLARALSGTCRSSERIETSYGRVGSKMTLPSAGR